MIVRLTFLGACVVVRQDAEAECRIFIEDLALGHVVPEMGGDEAVILQYVFDERAHPLSAFRSGILGQDPMTSRRELLRACIPCASS